MMKRFGLKLPSLNQVLKFKMGGIVDVSPVRKVHVENQYYTDLSPGIKPKEIFNNTECVKY